MKVSELISILEKCSLDATVKFDDTSCMELGSIERSNVTAVYEARCTTEDKQNFVILTNEREEDYE